MTLFACPICEREDVSEVCPRCSHSRRDNPWLGWLPGVLLGSVPGSILLLTTFVRSSAPLLLAPIASALVLAARARALHASARTPPPGALDERARPDEADEPRACACGAALTIHLPRALAPLARVVPCPRCGAAASPPRPKLLAPTLVVLFSSGVLGFELWVFPGEVVVASLSLLAALLLLHSRVTTHYRALRAARAAGYATLEQGSNYR